MGPSSGEDMRTIPETPCVSNQEIPYKTRAIASGLRRPVERHDTQSQRVSNQACHVPGFKPLHQLAAVRFDGFDADPQLQRNLFCRGAFSNKLENLTLSRRKVATRVARSSSSPNILAYHKSGNLRT